MGNAMSDTDEEGGKDHNPEMEDELSDGENENDGEKNSNLDLCHLFSDNAALRLAATKVKEKIPENVILQHNSHIAQWLEGREERLEDFVSMAQFCEMLMSQGVERVEAVRAFHQFDADGSGTADVETMIDVVNKCTGQVVLGELGKSIRTLQSCALIPGFVDVYAGASDPVESHGSRILKYLLRNRASSTSLPFPYLYSYNNICTMRTSVYNSMLEASKDDEIEPELEKGGTEFEKRTVHNCCSSVTVSSNTSDVHLLRSSSTFWQSDGAARSHWIRLSVKNGVVLKHLSVGVAAVDQSYMPELITVSVGNVVGKLHEIKEIKVDSHHNGQLVLLKNMKAHYPLVQINIKRCHGDGCDTRIHGVRAIGFKYVKDPGVTVLDASALWYLQMLTSTVSVTLPQTPALQSILLGHTKKALESMPPLVLSASSSERPAFLSKYVLAEIENFVAQLCQETNPEMMAEGLQVFLALHLARGSVCGLVKLLSKFVVLPNTTLPCAELLSKAMSVRNSCWEKIGTTFPLTCVGCDGGGGNNGDPGPESVIEVHLPSGNSKGSTSSTTKAYMTDEGKTKCTMIFRSEEQVQLTKIKIQVASGNKAPRHGLVCLYNPEDIPELSSEFNSEEHINYFSKYDFWGMTEFKFSIGLREAGLGGMPDNPVAYFQLYSDCDEIDVPVSWNAIGKYILIKFLEPKNEAATRIGIVSIRFSSIVRPVVLLEKKDMYSVVPDPSKKKTCELHEVVHSVLAFISSLAGDQVNKRMCFFKPQLEFLDLNDLNMNAIWNLHKACLERWKTESDGNDASQDIWRVASLHVLQLFHGLIPVLATNKSTSQDARDSLFQELCDIINSESSGDAKPQDNTSGRIKLIRQIIIDGASLFFPEKSKKRDELFKLLKTVSDKTSTTSTSLLFQSLCQFFSSVDPKGLLELPERPKEGFSSSETLDMMRSLLLVTSQEMEPLSSLNKSSPSTNGLNSPAQNGHQMTYLVKLTASLQTALLIWCWQQLKDPTTLESEELTRNINDIVSTYSCDVAEKACQFFDLFKSMDAETMKKHTDSEQPSFLFIVVRQLLLQLSSLVDKLQVGTKVTMLHNFKRLVIAISGAAETWPHFFSDITSNCWNEVGTEETVLRTWEVESPHEYLNHSNISQTFNCPGASKFVVEFDPRCETERRYDYLEFTDAKGFKLRFDQKVGTTKWPKRVVFSGPYLGFLFHSDSSNTEWGYKFTVSAKGSPDVPFSWLIDLQLGLVKVLGLLCGSTLSSNPITPHEILGTPEDVSELDILRSELWTSLFRGGYMVGRIQRSLSGKFVTGDESTIHAFLLEVVNAVEPASEEADTEKEDALTIKACKFLKKVKEATVNLPVGGKRVDKAVTSLFVAFVWHCQQLREDTEKFISGGDAAEVSDGIQQAYNAADAQRLSLASERQKWNVAEEKDEKSDPAELHFSKTIFLLKFAGLTKVQLKNELNLKLYKQMMMKKSSNKKPFVRNEIMDKYPSFRLVMEFVDDAAWTPERVHQLLQERTKFASAIGDVYMLTSEIIRIMSDKHPFQIPVVLFLVDLFSYQAKFAHHYADSLDGCGLEQESKVRRAYYMLVRQLVESFRKAGPSHEMDSKIIPAFDLVQACLLHLLSVEWNLHDLSFVLEMRFPEFFLNIAKETVKMRDLIIEERSEEEELKEFEQAMKWYTDVADDINDWYSRNDKHNKKELKMFVARFSDVLDVEITCDGCDVTLPGQRYRCLQCDDLDLCTSCFSGGVELEEHKDDHDMVHLIYKCNHCQAFIVGTRIHCNQCDDFDLCLGCHTKRKFPAGHTEEHSVTKNPMVKLKTSQSSNASLKAYLHQHVWLLYSSLTLRLSDILYNQETTGQYLDSDYIKIVGQLHQQCITLATSCLSNVSADVDGEKEKEMPLCQRREFTFARHSQERILGLIGAVMPSVERKEHILDMGFNFWTKDFLGHLFKVSRGENGYELNSQHLTLRLIGRLLVHSEPEMADQYSKQALPKDTPPLEKPMVPGQQIIAYLFSSGAKAFEKNSLEWACSVARMLEMLFSTSQWRPVLLQHISHCVQTLKHNLDMSAIFPMFVIAGFPEVLTTGTLVEYTTSMESQNGVVLKHFPDKHQSLVVDLKTRKRHTVKDQQVFCRSSPADEWETDNISKFVTFIMDTVARIRAGEELSVEVLWVLSLALKMVNRCFTGDLTSVLCKEFFTPGFMQSLVLLACKGTGLNQHWLFKDLEVLSLMLYTHDGSTSKKTKINSLKEKEKGAKKKKKPKLVYSDASSDSEPNSKNKKKNDDDEDDDSYDDENDEDDDDDDDDDDDEKDFDDEDDDEESLWTTTDSDEEEEEKSSYTLPEDGEKRTKELLDTLHSELDIPHELLQAVVSMNEGNAENIIDSMLENFSYQKDNEKLTAALNKWKAISKEQAKKEPPVNKGIDTGITLHPSIGSTHKIPEVAEKETGDNPQNLFIQQDKLAGEISERMRGKSSQLLKRELEKHGRSGSRDYLIKVNTGMCVLYARHVLTGVLAFWPDTGPVINSSLLGCKDVKQIPCVLDLLYRIDTRGFFSKVVDKVIHMCEASSLVPIAYTAAQFMEEVTLAGVERESNHNYTDKDIRRGHIEIPGASYLTVTFDSRCATSDDDTLVFSTNQSMDKDVHNFSGSSRAKWTSFHLPGDTLFFKFMLEDYDRDLDTQWGYKFTVTPGTKDSFQTGHMILEAVLSSSLARSLPLGQLWSSLVYVACKQPGGQRLQAISLMLKIVAVQGKSGAEKGKTGPDINLSLLKPLWELYRTMTSKEGDSNIIQPAVVLALTDLFLHTENLACEWDMTEKYLVALMNISDIRMAIVQGLVNVAAVGYEIGYSNAATDNFKNIYRIMSDMSLMSALKSSLGKKDSDGSKPDQVEKA